MHTPANVLFLVRSSVVALFITLAAGVVLLGLAAFGPGTAAGANFTVDSTIDAFDSNPGDGVCETPIKTCSIRAAIQEANAIAGADIVTVPAGTYNLTGGELTISDDLTVNGAAAATTVLDGDGTERIFKIELGATVEISDLTVQDGKGVRGGGIRNEGVATLNRITVTGNDATVGGGVSNVNIMTINDSEIVGNTSGTSAGIENEWDEDGSVLTINSSVISGNDADHAGGGIGNSLDGVVTINDSIISGNSAQNSIGGVGNSTGGEVTINGSTISGNSPGGISNSGTMTVNNSSISGNVGYTSWIGGIINQTTSDLTVNNSTISGNSGSALFNDDVARINNTTITGHVRGVRNNADLTFKNTIIINAASIYDNCWDPVTSAGNNLDSDGSCGFTQPGDISNADPLLGPLADNGGPTLTHALLPGSPAIDAGSSGCPPPGADQRGFVRPADGDGDTVAACDIGAFEAGALAPTPTATETPCGGPCPTLTPLNTPTFTTTPTFTPTKQPFPGDTDGDGCADKQENVRGTDFLDPWDYFNPSGDGFIRLDDILGVIEHYSPDGDPPYDVNWDAGPVIGPNHWDRDPPDGKIDLPNDILGIILQYHFDCSTPPLPGPTPSTSTGLAFSIGVDTDGDTTDDCSTSGGTTKCVAPDVTFTLNLYLDSLPNLVSDYVALNTALTFSGVTSPDNATLGDWDDCFAVPNSYEAPGESAMFCTSHLLPLEYVASAYTGRIGTVDFTCASDGQISMVHGELDTALFRDAATFHIEENGSAETLTINCSVTPTNTPVPTDTPTPAPDTDGDGCSDDRENGSDPQQGGMRDWLNPHDFYDVRGISGGPPDGFIDLPNDILGVILHFSPFGYTPGTPSIVGNTTYDTFDRGPRVGGGPYNMTAPDGFIDLPNDILGVILQFNHDCQ